MTKALKYAIVCLQLREGGRYVVDIVRCRSRWQSALHGSLLWYEGPSRTDRVGSASHRGHRQQEQGERGEVALYDRSLPILSSRTPPTQHKNRTPKRCGKFFIICYLYQ